jgi:hypothetical protein
LDRLGVAWVVALIDDQPHPPPTREAFLAALASSDEARMRLALIPLFLARSDYAREVTKAVGLVSGRPQVTLICYYTAAALLQQKYARQLDRLGVKSDPLPDTSGRKLDLSRFNTPDERLRQLADRQAERSGRSLNWYGTYEHAAERFLKRVELDLIWVGN